MCDAIIVLLTLGIPTFAMIISSISKGQTDFDKETSEYIFTSMAMIPSLISTIVGLTLTCCDSSGIGGCIAFLIICCVISIVIILGVCFSTDTLFSFWEFFYAWFWQNPSGSSTALSPDTFASHWYLGQIYLILFCLSLGIVGCIFWKIYICSCKMKKKYCKCKSNRYNNNTTFSNIEDKSKPLVNPIADNV